MDKDRSLENQKPALSRRALLFCAPALLLSSNQTYGQTLRSELKKLKVQFNEEGIQKYNFKAVERVRKIKMGACLPRTLSYPIKEEIQSILNNNFSIIVPEITLNWDQDFKYGYKMPFGKNDISEILEIAKVAGAEVKGHALYYYKVFPTKLLADLAYTKSDIELEKKILDMVVERVGYYKDKINHWVINEVFDHKGNYRADPLIKRLGPQIIDKVCKAAMSANSKISFEICDNNISINKNDQPLFETIKMINRLRKQNVNISHIGVQGHFYMDEAPDLRTLPYKIMQKEGLTFSVNELDVNDRNFKGTDAEREYLIAGKYYSYLKMISDMPNLTEVTSWTPFDKDNWVRRGDIDGGGLDEKSSTGWFDLDYKPKFLYFVTAKALMN